MYFGERLVSFIDKHGRKISLFLIITIFVLALILAILLIIKPLITKINSPTQLSLNIAPQSAEVYIDGEEYSNGVFEIEPGTYSISIKKDGFESKVTEVKVEPHTTNVYYDYILSKNEGMAYFEKSQADLDILKRINDREVTDFINEYNNKLKVRDVLPISGLYNSTAGIDGAHSLYVNYKIREKSGVSDYCEKVFCLVVESETAFNENLENVVEKELSKKGYDMNNYEVKYVTK